jgi:hypothetical protein
MRKHLIIAAAAAALASGGVATAQDERLPETLANPNLVNEGANDTALAARDVDQYLQGAYNDIIIKERTGNSCAVRYVAYNQDTGDLDFGAPVDIPCVLTIEEAVAGTADTSPAAATIQELQQSVQTPPRDYGYMPLRWRGDWAAWRAHQDLCADTFRTYDRETDMFYALPGDRVYCQLGLTPLQP